MSHENRGKGLAIAVGVGIVIWSTFIAAVIYMLRH